jgi:Putative zinc-finger
VVILSRSKHHRDIKVRPRQEGELRGGSDLNCQNFREITHSYIDRELGLVHAAEVERHLEQCDECDLIYCSQVALRSSLQDPSFYHRAPADLKKRISEHADMLPALHLQHPFRRE